jgi:2-polyprenyl-3-methyl-5-hydroxy-6-metoxy-1,4-benzoquinol methylase
MVPHRAASRAFGPAVERRAAILREVFQHLQRHRVRCRETLSAPLWSGTPSTTSGAKVLDWDHNAYYQRLILRHLPQSCNRVLDVGCGAGAFAVELAKRAEHVDALDRSAAMIEEARRVAPPNVTCILADLLQVPLPDTV